MPIKSIVTLARGDEDDALSLAFATRLARDHGAAVRVVPILPDAAGAMFDFGMAMGAPYTPEVVQALADARQASRTAIRGTCLKACQAAGVAFERHDTAPSLYFADEDVAPWLAVSHNVGLTDLVVVSQVLVDPNEVIGDILLRLRLPLFVGRGSPERLTGTVAIAWDGSLEASRAVKAALPLLAGAEQVVVLQAPSGLDPLVDASFDTLANYLRLNGIVGVEQLAVNGLSEGVALHAAAAEQGAALLVAGAFGRGRVQETLFGGVTRDLLAPKDGPCLLLAH